MNNLNNDITVEEIETVRNLFSRMANSVIEASSAGNDIRQLREELQNVKDAIRAERDRNSELDEALSAVRRQRDEVIRERDVFKNEIDRIAQTERNWGEKNDQLQRDVIQLQSDLTQARRDRDDACMKNLELEDKITKGSHVVIEGDFLSGFKIVGPFATKDEAYNWGDGHSREYNRILEIRSPVSLAS